MMQSVSQAGLMQSYQNPFMAAFPHPAMGRLDGSGGLQLHPAFLHPLYSGLPHRGVVATSAQDKRKAFTIDAILGQGKNPRSGDPGMEHTVRDNSTEKGPGDLAQLHRQQQRLQAAHPYLSPLACHSAFGFRPPHHTVLKAADKHDKKRSNGCSPEWKQGKNKRVRTIFTPEQLERLEAEFERQQYMVGTERYYLAASLNLTEAQVKVWFQNRRIKWRKQNLEQQHARLAKLDLLKGPDVSPPASDSENEEENKFREMDSEEILVPDEH